MAKCADGRSSTLALIQLALMLSGVYWSVTDKLGCSGERSHVADGGKDDDDDEVSVQAMSVQRCSSATIFGLLTADCTALNISSLKTRSST